MKDPTTSTNLTDYWQQHIDLWTRSGQSQTKFCQANNLPYHQFVYWRSKFERGTNDHQERRESGGFVAVDYRHDISSGLTLSLPNGLVLRGICADNVPVVRQLLEQL